MNEIDSQTRSVRSRRAIESLRSGVPNRDAVVSLGCDQPEIENAFRKLLAATAESLATETQGRGILVSGGFGSGKSHLLEYLASVALDEGFVCSRVVVSKETPLFDPAKLYRAALRGGVVPGRRGGLLTEVAASIDHQSETYRDFFTWLHKPDVSLNSRFPATVLLHEREKDPEILNRIISFWEGDPLGGAPVATMRGWLRAHREASSYRLEKVVARDLWPQRFRFASRLISAAGYRGWVLLIDEVELIGRYSFKQRARSYAELARWAGVLQDESCPGLATVFAITSDYAEAVLAARNDNEMVPGKLRASLIDADHLLASQAERGMRLIEGEAMRLKGLTGTQIDETRDRIRQIHATAYNWDPPQPSREERLTSTLMRQYVRRWINEWDLKRLYPDEDIHTVVEDLRMDYSEDRDLETTMEDEDREPSAE